MTIAAGTFEQVQAEHELYDAVASKSHVHVPPVPIPPPTEAFPTPAASPLRKRRPRFPKKKKKNLSGIGFVEVESDELWRLPASSYLNKPAVLDVLRASTDAEMKGLMHMSEGQSRKGAKKARDRSASGYEISQRSSDREEWHNSGTCGEHLETQALLGKLLPV